MNALKAREGSIEDAMNAAEQAREDMEKLTADNEKLMAEARMMIMKRISTGRYKGMGLLLSSVSV